MAPIQHTTDLYQTLGLDPSATHEQITRAYRQLALKLHPDRNKAEDAKESFQKIGAAYETLSDPSQREEYDKIWPSIKLKFYASESWTKSNAGQSPESSTQRSSQESSSGNGFGWTMPKFLTKEQELSALQASRKERLAQWESTKQIFENNIAEMRNTIDQLEQEVRDLNIPHETGFEDLFASMWADKTAYTNDTSNVKVPHKSRLEGLSASKWADQGPQTQATADADEHQKMKERKTKQRKLATIIDQLRKEQDRFQDARTAQDSTDGSDFTRIAELMAQIKDARFKGGNTEASRLENRLCPTHNATWNTIHGLGSFMGICSGCYKHVAHLKVCTGCRMKSCLPCYRKFSRNQSETFAKDNESGMHGTSSG